MWNWNGMMGWGGGFGVFHVVWWALVVTAIVLLARWIAFGRGRGEEDRALSILRERYARGEIGKEEFEARKRDLEG